MYSLNLLVKPTHRCNLSCTYCYDKQFSVQEDMTLTMVEKIASMIGDRETSWTWHGGEPLMMPVEFYQAAHAILSNYGITSASVQSNGSLLNEQWIHGVKKWNWKYSISFDGKHNSLTRGHTDAVLQALNLLKELHFPAGIIRVVTPENVAFLADDYDFVKPFVSAFDFNHVFRTNTTNPLAETTTYLEQYAILLITS